MWYLWEIAIFGHLGLRNPWTNWVEIYVVGPLTVVVHVKNPSLNGDLKSNRWKHARVEVEPCNNTQDLTSINCLTFMYCSRVLQWISDAVDSWCEVWKLRRSRTERKITCIHFVLRWYEHHLTSFSLHHVFIYLSMERHRAILSYLPKEVKVTCSVKTYTISEIKK